MYSLEQLELLMMVAEADEPVATALQVRRRWQYILNVAEAACRGSTVDAGLPQVARNAPAYVTRARGIVAVLDEWLAEHARRPLSDAS